MKYFKLLGYYFLEVVGASVNFVCSLVGTYPTLDLGVTWLLLFESRRVIKQTEKSNADRQNKENQANKLETEAKYSDGQDV